MAGKQETNLMIDDKDLSDSTLRFILWKALERYSTRDLLNFLYDHDPIVRTSAAKQLQLRGTPEIFRKVKLLCHHKTDTVREIAAFVLGQLGTPQFPFKKQSVSVLIKLLKKDSSHEVRAAAAAALGHLGSNEAMESLLQSVHDKHDQVRTCVAFALGSMLPSTKVEDVLRKLSFDKKREVRSWARLSLDILKDRKVKASLASPRRRKTKGSG